MIQSGSSDLLTKFGGNHIITNAKTIKYEFFTIKDSQYKLQLRW